MSASELKVGDAQTRLRNEREEYSDGFCVLPREAVYAADGEITALRAEVARLKSTGRVVADEPWVREVLSATKAKAPACTVIQYRDGWYDAMAYVARLLPAPREAEEVADAEADAESDGAYYVTEHNGVAVKVDKNEAWRIHSRLAYHLGFAAASRASQWVKCSERLPDRGRQVLWGDSKTGRMRTGDLPFPQSNIVAHGKHDDTSLASDWTHWRELPDAPERGE